MAGDVARQGACQPGGKRVITVLVRAPGKRNRSRRRDGEQGAALAPAGVKSGLAVVFLVMGGYGALLFTLALHLQEGYGYTPLASGLTFATYAVGFAAANLTWSRLPQRF